VRAIRALVDDVLRDMTREFDRLYAAVGRPSIPPERLLRAQLLQIFYSLRSERLLMEQLDYNLLFRWLVGLEMDEAMVKRNDTTLRAANGSRDQLVDLLEPQHRTGNSDTNDPVLGSQAHGPECALEKWRVDNRDLKCD
jgi:transposase